MTINTQTPTLAGVPWLNRAASHFSGWGSAILTKAGDGIAALQMARMLSTLSNMSDSQLAQIGITRRQIPAYANRLMGRDETP